MEQVIQTFKRTDAETRIPILRMEIDYELISLHDAMMVKDQDMMKETKNRLEQLRLEWLQLEA
ncbi:hypothetical protein [Salsuginibacillus kocurii]|uniref:hypothetical protein n=1 Tax=Salsuginibacillus kocurii TaxID=427078 RepID=UPI000377B036|nr:hypothetical protein [Salsuginibacillus kocurii]